MSLSDPVIVVGGGWAGLAAAVELARYDIPVTVLESAKQLGGRARRVQFKNQHPDQGADAGNDSNEISINKTGIDNGQHLLIGAYDSTLSLLHTIGVREELLLKRKPLSLQMLSPNQKTLRLNTLKLPAPIHLLLALITASGLSLKERYGAIKFCAVMAKQQFNLAEDVSCLSLLKHHRQSDKLIKTLWEPLCLAALNTHVNEASAIIFLRTLRETFSYARQHSDFLFTASDLGRLLPDPALDYIEKNGGSIRLAHRVTQLNIENGAVTGVTTEDKSLDAPYVILATPLHTTEQLLTDIHETRDLSQKLKQFKSNPIVTVYLQYPKTVRLKTDMVGMVDTTSQWLFDRELCQQPGLISVVISGTGSHMSMDNASLTRHVIDEIHQLYPKWPEPMQNMVIREKRATFHCSPDIHKIRPRNQTSLQGLLLAGDYTDTGLPATLESAVRSGIRSAKTILKMQTAN